MRNQSAKNLQLYQFISRPENRASSAAYSSQSDVRAVPQPITEHGYQSRGSGSAVASALASHQGHPGSIPGWSAPGSSHVGIVLDNTACRRAFSGYSRFPVLAFQRRSILGPHFMSCPGMTGNYGSQLESPSLGGCCLALGPPPPPWSQETCLQQTEVLRYPTEDKCTSPLQVFACLSKDTGGCVGDVGAGAKEAGNAGNCVLGVTAEEVDGAVPFVADRAALVAVDDGSDVGVTAEEDDGTIST
ncbi:hypothetical protein PR048_002773 [Dryococelus australis]|uniref:Uncharacterized protein n=1 Tax=Dryococelus australis TaxID=614101 RepID=A0ABQ9ILS6_9NEOP|nr:hypothetical protein PR048_002773 [Dryococelus australis]